MSAPSHPLRAEIDRALAAGRPAEAIAYLAELCVQHPEDRQARTALAIALGDAGHPAAALRVLRALADRLAHQGYLLPAMVVVRHGLEHAIGDPGLLATLRRLHVRGTRAKAGQLPSPPPLAPRRNPPSGATAGELLALPLPERLERVAQIATDFGPAGEPAIPLPMPLFCELEQDAFVETVQHLRYRRVPAGFELLREGEPGDSLFVLASGHVAVEKGGTALATLGPGAVLGEMALITGTPRSATAVASGEVELFELTRRDVEELARARPKIAEELVEYARKRLLGNLLRTSPLFARFDETARYLLLDRFQRQGFAPGGTIIAQGRAGTGLYVIAAGEVQVAVASAGGEPVVVANLGPGEVFGEISLLNDQPTSATVTARDHVGVLFLPRADFQEILAAHPSVRDYLASLSADRLQASRAAADATDVSTADDLIVL